MKFIKPRAFINSDTCWGPTKMSSMFLGSCKPLQWPELTFKIMQDCLLNIGLDLVLVQVGIRISTKGEDHPGLFFECRLLWLEFSYSFLDSRHWDYDNDCFETYHKEGERFSWVIFKLLCKHHGKWYFAKKWRVRYEFRGGRYVQIRQIPA